MTKDSAVRIAELQKSIEAYIGLDAQGIIYDYSQDGEKVRLDAITVNPRHKQSFLFHTSVGLSKVEALEDLLSYVRNYKEKDSTFTVQWSVNGDDELHTSYFRAKNILTALDKLYFNRDPNTITIFNVSLNPIS